MSKKVFLLIMLFGVFTIGLNAAASDWPTVYTDSDLIYHERVGPAFEDSQGNLWVGNMQGFKNGEEYIVSVFDGTDWTHYSNYDFEIDPGYSTTDIAEDTNGHIWIVYRGLGVIEYFNNEWTVYKYNIFKDEGISKSVKENKDINVNYVNLIFSEIEDLEFVSVDITNGKWFTCRDMFGAVGALRLDNSYAWSMYDESDGMHSNSAEEVFADSHGNVWFGHKGEDIQKFPQPGGVSVYNIAQDTWTTYEGFGSEIPQESVYGITEDDDGNVWIASTKTTMSKPILEISVLTKFDGTQWTHFPIENFYSNFSHIDYKDDQIFIAVRNLMSLNKFTNYGLGIYSISSNEFEAVNPDHLSPSVIIPYSVQACESGIWVSDEIERRVLLYKGDAPIVVEDTNIPGSPGVEITNVIIYENQTYEFFFNGYDPDGNPLGLFWFLNGSLVSSGNRYTFVPDPVKESGEYEMRFVADDSGEKGAKGTLIYEWNIMVLNADNPITVNSVTPAPNTSTDPSISTAGGSYNMTEGETLNFLVDADDADGSLLWRNWYVNEELVWLNADFDFSTHFMSSGGSPYDIKLYLQGQQGDYQEFHWTVNVSNKEAVTYANAPMILSGSAMIEGINAQAGDAIAAYSGNELRGEILLDNSDFSNFEINLAHDNEEISFVIYDSDNNVIKTVHKVLNGEIGTAQNILIHGYEEVSSSFALSQDWNYVSFNTIPEDNSVSSVFHNMNISQIQTVDEVYSPSNPEFLNTLKEIKPGIGYLVKMNSNSSIFVNGYSAENSEIQLYEGWNLIGYTERSSADVETAFGSVMDKIIEIKSEVGVYSSDMPAYMNTLSYIEENKAYWVKCSEDCVLDFPNSEDKRHNSSYFEVQDFNNDTSNFSAEGNGLRDTRSTSPTRPPVNVSFGNIAVLTNSFVIYAEISNPSDNTLCAYNNNELRGISQIVENNNKYYTSIVVNSDIAGEEISLKINNNTIKTISSIPGETIGKDNFLQLDGSLENEIPASFKVNLFPNPFNPEINISFELPKAERINISVFDINGKLVKTLEDNVFNSGKHSITWNGTDSNNNKMASGIYFVKVKSDSYNTTEKIVMLK